MNWPIEKLGDHVDILSGFAFPSDGFNTEAGTPVVRIRDVKAGQSTTFFAGSYERNFLIQSGEILVGMDGQFNAAVWQGGPALLNQRVCRIAPRRTLDRRFLFHQLPSALKKIEDKTAFVTVKHLSVSEIKEIDIALPPLPEQQRIAAILDQAEALEAKRRQALAKLDTLTQSLFLEMFGDVSRTTQEWPLMRFGSIANCKLGKMLDGSKQTGTEAFPYLRNANVQWNRLDLTSLLSMDFAKADRRKFSLQKGDLLICEGGEPGRAAVWNEELKDCYFQKAIHRCRLDPQMATSKFFVFAFWQLAKAKALYYSTSTIGHLTAEKLEELRVPVPPVHLQEDFTRKVSMIENTNATYIKSFSGLQKSLSALQHKAFRGEL